MKAFLNSPLTIGSLTLEHRLIQGPLAGYSCAPFRALFSLFRQPSYAVSEMLSAHSVLYHDAIEGRFLYRSPEENKLCYQLSGTNPDLMSAAALRLESLKADLIDLNCGCPKNKIRKKGAGSALLENPLQLIALVQSVKKAIRIPLTVKIRLLGNKQEPDLAKAIMDAGADAIIVHGRQWREDYDRPCKLEEIARIKSAVSIPVIANGDIHNDESLKESFEQTGCDAFMISRASTGKPWIFKALLEDMVITVEQEDLIRLFLRHLKQLSTLESEIKAVLQSKSLVRYYFRDHLEDMDLKSFYECDSLEAISRFFS